MVYEPPEPCFLFQTNAFPKHYLLYFLFGLSTLTIWWILDQLQTETINAAKIQQDLSVSSKINLRYNCRLYVYKYNSFIYFAELFLF